MEDSTMSTEKVKLRTVEDIINRLRHDPSLEIDLSQVYVAYHDGKYAELQKMAFNSFALVKDGGDIPMHRIVRVGYNNIILWDKEKKLDRLCGSGYTKPEEKWPLVLSQVNNNADGDNNDDNNNQDENDEDEDNDHEHANDENNDNNENNDDDYDDENNNEEGEEEQEQTEQKDTSEQQQQQEDEENNPHFNKHKKKKKKAKQARGKDQRKDNKKASRHQHKKEKKLKPTELSKTLSWILRHGAGELQLNMDKGGFVLVSEVLNTDALKQKNVTLEDIQHVVATDKKQRYTLKQESDQYWIRANQGHSLKSEGTIQLDSDHLLRDLTIAELHEKNWKEVVCHGTYWDAFSLIVNSGGLNRMTRTHIHFACGDSLEDEKNIKNKQEPKKSDPEENKSEEKVKSGMRNDCELLIYIDVIQAIQDGYKFQISANNVILCRGDEKGFLPIKYFWKIAKFAKTKPSDAIWNRHTSTVPLEACLQMK